MNSPFPHRVVRWRRSYAHPFAQWVLDMHISARSLAVALSSLLSSSSCMIDPGPTSSLNPEPNHHSTSPKISRGRTVSLHTCHRGESEIVHRADHNAYKIFTVSGTHTSASSWVKPRDEPESDSSSEDHDGVKHWHDGFWTDIGTEGKTYPTLVVLSDRIGNCPPLLG
jgi:hypothetical protein